MSRDRLNLLVSTDIGTDFDDGAAIRIAMASAYLHLVGIYVTNGPVDIRAKIAHRMRNLENHDALIAIGESNALATSLPLYTTGLEAALLPNDILKASPNSLGIETNWLGAITRQLKTLGKCVIASIAPLTNMAILLEKMPELASNMDSLYIMGGREGELEHNFSHDPLAASRVLDSGLNIVIVPADTCSLYDADMSFLTNLDGTPGNLYLSQMARLWKLSHDARLYRTSELLQEMLRNKAAGYFSGDELFYGMIELMSNTKKIFSEPQAFLQAFDSWLGLASSLDSPKVRELLDYLDGSGRKTIKVSDAIVIYAIEHPENVEVEKAHVSCDKSGRMQLKRGNSHSIIRGFDVKHFDSYFRKRMLGVQKLKAIPPARKQRQVA